MILDTAHELIALAPQPVNRNAGAQSAFSRKRFYLAAVGLAMMGGMSIAPAALSQTSASSKTVQTKPDAVVQHSTCVSDPQGLMCHSNQHNVNAATATPQASRASNHTVTVLPALSKAQMERVSDVLLGLLYFVLPIGFSLTLFLHDRRQAERAATLEAQIQLLEKLWEQSPQA